MSIADLLHRKDSQHEAEEDMLGVEASVEIKNLPQEEHHTNDSDSAGLDVVEHYRTAVQPIE